MSLDPDLLSAQLAFIRVESARLATQPDAPNAAARRERLEALGQRLTEDIAAHSPFRLSRKKAGAFEVRLVSWLHDVCGWHVALHGYGAPQGFIDRAHAKFAEEAPAGMSPKALKEAWQLALTAVRREASGITVGGVAYWPASLPGELMIEARVFAEDVIRSRQIRHAY